MQRDIFSDEHELFRAEFRRFAQAEIEPHLDEWNANGISDRSAWRKMGEGGYLGANAPEEYGGAGGDFLFDAIIMEELARIRAHGLMMSLHSDICMPYLEVYGSHEQKQAFLAPAIAGETILAIILFCLFPAYFPVIAYGYAALCYVSAGGRILLAWRTLD